MKKSLLLLLLFICVSCSYTIIEKKDVIKTQNGVFIQAYYSENLVLIIHLVIVLL